MFVLTMMQSFISFSHSPLLMKYGVTGALLGLPVLCHQKEPEVLQYTKKRRFSCSITFAH